MAYSNGYLYRRKITIDPTKVGGTGTLSNFPVVISGTFSYLATVANGGKVTNASGYDIKLELTDGTTLNYERASYTATTGNIILWVNIPSLDGTNNTEIYLYYGNSSITTDQSNKTATWNSNYVTVYHMGTGESQEDDSTSNNYSLSENGTVTQTTGILGNCREVATANIANYLSKTDATDLDGMSALTFQAWINPSLNNGIPRGIISKRTTSAIAYSYGAFLFTSGYLNFDTGSGTGGLDTRTPTTSAIPINLWTQFHCTFDGSLISTSRKKIYLNGSLNVTAAANVTSIYSGAGTLTAFYMGAGSDGYQGKIDEIRILKTALSADWITTEYNNQNSPSTFYSIGTEEASNRRIFII